MRLYVQRRYYEKHWLHKLLPPIMATKYYNRRRSCKFHVITKTYRTSKSFINYHYSSLAIIPFKLDMAPSSSVDVTRAMRGHRKRPFRTYLRRNGGKHDHILLQTVHSPLFPWDRRCRSSWSLDANETRESTKCPWVGQGSGGHGYFFRVDAIAGFHVIKPKNRHYLIN